LCCVHGAPLGRGILGGSGSQGCAALALGYRIKPLRGYLHIGPLGFGFWGLFHFGWFGHLVGPIMGCYALIEGDFCYFIYVYVPRARQHRRGVSEHRKGLF
jgi:hypothetical protein